MTRLSLITGFAAIAMASGAYAGGGGGCMYGKDYSDASLAKVESAESSPVIAAELDPKLLALQKRLQLESQSQTETIQVPN